jgi:hypothetical protein
LLGVLSSFVVGVCAMTPVIFITIGFLSCWFLLYALVEWTQDSQRKSAKKLASGGEISEGEHKQQEQVISFRKKEPRRETCV